MSQGVLLSKQDAYDFLSKIPLGVFGTVSNENEPHLSTLFYVVDTDLNFYFITRSHTKKVENIARGSKVSIVISDRRSFTTAQVQGTAVQLSGIDKIKVIFKMFTDVYRNQDIIEKGNLFNWAPPISNIEKGDIVIFEVKPDWIRYADYKNTSPLAENAFQEVAL